jgi:acetyl-CoA C-acetyltransferase
MLAAAATGGIKARARVIATANMGGDPTLMLNAPVPAARKVLAKAGLEPDDIDLFLAALCLRQPGIDVRVFLRP